MKYTSLFLAGLIFTTIFSFAQADIEADFSKGKTKLSGIALREGVIIGKKFEEIGTFTSKSVFSSGNRHLQVQFVTLSDAATGENQSGYLFSTLNQTTGYLQYFTNFVDIEEMPGLVKFLDFIESKVANPAKDIEYWFNSLDMSIIVFYQPESGKQPEKWSYRVRVDRTNQNSTFNFTGAESFLEFANKIRSDFEKR